MPEFFEAGEVSEEQKVETVVFAGSGKFFGIGEVVDNSRFRSLQKLFHVTSYVRRFVENLKVILGRDGKACRGEISAQKMDSSLKFWIKHEQLFLQRKTNFTKMKHSLRLSFDKESLLRCRTRISSDETLNYGIGFPTLLQRSSNFTMLRHHNKVYHCGVAATLNHIRNFYWIVKGRKTARLVLRKCLICNVIQKKVAIPEDTPAFPPFRIQFSYCFENVGLDYISPLFHKDVVQNKMQKCYILLFTFSVSRAIHLEITNDLGVQRRI